MRIERAKNQLKVYKTFRSVGKSFSVDLYDEADNIIEALEKQVPIKPKSKFDFRYNCNVCPACETENTCRMLLPWEKYCPDCGQAIDWSDAPEETTGGVSQKDIEDFWEGK